MVHRLDEANRMPGAVKPYSRTSRREAQGDEKSAIRRLYLIT